MSRSTIYFSVTGWHKAGPCVGNRSAPRATIAESVNSPPERFTRQSIVACSAPYRSRCLQ